MNSSAHFLRLVWSSTSDRARSTRANRSAYNPVYAALEEMYQVDPREARRLMRQMLRDHRQVNTNNAVRRPTPRSRQLDLFAAPQAQAAVREDVTTEKVIPWRGLVLLEQHSGP